MEKVKRNRAQTTQRIIDAFEVILAERGLQHVGVNRVAEQAGVSKVLIYRYFGGLNGLIDYYIKMGKIYPDFPPALLEQIRPENETELGRLWYRQVTQLFRQFRANQAARELLKANVIEHDPTAEAASQSQDQEIQRLVSQLSFVKGTDVEAVSAVVLGAMSYLTLLADNNRTLVGIDLRSESGWKRIEQAIELIYSTLSQTVSHTDGSRFSPAHSAVLDGHWK
ncbi:transcriptional regulator, TetR family [Fibrella aestuarina BUZ 2]|uniref:Transcriptional regulator, TetR family n=1 Tax=Fibrella aestuarina BUZ 2 TaxID=1166018 RepID=I0K3V1_9BACT|nr:TetR/AcrR family transcriptional regulator [Fibrella aestuarina]CCG98804.1 transcriptional regulator, TetR family [Fibrella aestuarina BUZ 2]